ncbi:GNAT family N-acetyltransferase [Humidisolicoccus flavus]|uniref:GNAT family N-acetyltransferase n=1 Tax=Humidisolicoccus flavus TaxID=3111414 RepID=UPI003249D9BF
MSAITVAVLRGPKAPEATDPDTLLWRAFIDMRNACTTAFWNGDRTHEFTHQEAFATWSNQHDEKLLLIAALDGDQVVGGAVVTLGITEQTSAASVEVSVLPEHRRRGVATALATAIETIVRSEHRTLLQAWVDHAAGSGEQLESPTGFGSIPASNPEVAFLQKHGFALEQIERMSSLNPVTAEPSLEAHLAEAIAASSPRYAVQTWSGSTPSEHLAGLAALHARMVTDAPSAGLEFDEEEWDPARVERYENAQIAGGRLPLRSVAIDTQTGDIVAFSTIVIPELRTRPSYQHDTLVHADHRGARLGLLVKTANLLALRTLAPECSQVLTWNAEENRPMLRVNEALGFEAIGYEGAWQRRLQ